MSNRLDNVVIMVSMVLSVSMSMETEGTLVLVGIVRATGDGTSNPSTQKLMNGSEKEVDDSCGS